MNSEIEMVREFHRKHRLPAVSLPVTQFMQLSSATRIINDQAVALGKMIEFTNDARMLRAHLMTEELGETLHGLMWGNRELLLDGLADLQYVIIGTAITYDLPLKEAFEEVHNSNMTKSRSKGNHPKGPHFIPPDIAGVLRCQK